MWSNAATDYDVKPAGHYCVKPATCYENKTATQFITGGGFVFNLLLLRMSQNEVDDAYLGGENPGGKAVCGSENKVPLIAAAQINDKNHPLYVIFSWVKAFSNAEVKAWANRSLTPATTVVSDGLWCFQSVTQAGCIQ